MSAGKQNMGPESPLPKGTKEREKARHWDHRDRGLAGNVSWNRDPGPVGLEEVVSQVETDTQQKRSCKKFEKCCFVDTFKRPRECLLCAKVLRQNLIRGKSAPPPPQGLVWIESYSQFCKLGSHAGFPEHSFADTATSRRLPGTRAL